MTYLLPWILLTIYAAVMFAVMVGYRRAANREHMRVVAEIQANWRKADMRKRDRKGRFAK